MATLQQDNVITSVGLAPAPTIKTVPQPQDTTNYAGITGGVTESIISDYTNLNNRLNSGEKQQTGTAQGILDVMGELTGKTAFSQGANESAGVNKEAEKLNKYAQQLADLNAQATSLNREAQAIPLQVQEQNRNTGATDRGVAPQEAGALRLNALRALSIGQQSDIAAAAATGSQLRLQAAKDKAQQMVDLKYKPLEEALAIKQKQYELNKDILASIDKKRTEALTVSLAKEAKDLEEAKAREKSIQDILTTAGIQQAPADLLARAQKAKTPSEAAMILGQYAGDFYKTELLKQSIETEKAQRAKIYADLAKTNAETNAANAFAKLPTNQKIQANIASGKIQPGQLVSLSTGEIPKNISADKVDGLLALKDLAKKTKEYNDVFTRFEEEALLGGAGLATGLKNVPFPSGTKTALDGLRSEITDLLARARSGAALTAYETAEYEKKLPSSFNSSLGLGKQGTDKIKALQSSLDSTLNTKLQGYGVTFAEGIEDDYLDTVESSLKNLGTQGLNFSGYAASLTQ